ncbi:MAG: hypothetical protein HN350_04955 [Phycisphaerales bacterium]|jgi:flagellar basal body-associated protein FliL|nr:hypothetical protein [Phycisphaerales bacterium]
MKGKLKIIILAVIAIVSFGAAYVVTPLLVDKPAPTASGEDEQKDPADTPPSVPGVLISPESVQTATIAMKREELGTLITELRLKLDDCRAREKGLAEREKRVKIAGDILTKQAQDLEKLRLGLIPVLQRYQEIKKDIESTQIQITAAEDKNIKLLAGRYDAMGSEGAAKILIDLWSGKQEDLAIKILYYMQARSSAKVLAAISLSDDESASALAARLSEKFPTVRKPSAKKEG